MNDVCLLVIDDGRGHLNDCLLLAGYHLDRIDKYVIIDDSDHELGFAGAIQAGWDSVLESECEFVFHLESDFRLQEFIPVRNMMRSLVVRPQIAQIALKRQPWSAQEIAAGGIVELNPGSYEEESIGAVPWYVTKHRNFWTTNPSLYKTTWCALGWPNPPDSERKFSDQVFSDPEVYSAFWGRKFDPPLVTHIGSERKGHGY